MAFCNAPAFISYTEFIRLPRVSLKAMGPSRRFWRIVRCVCVFAAAMGFEDGTDACETACPGISDLLTNAEPLMEANSLQSKEETWNLYCENKTIMDCATSSCAGTLVLGKVIFKSDADELSCVCGSCPDVVKFKEILAHLIFSQTLQQEWDYGCPAVSTMTCMKQSCAEYYGSYPPPSIKDKEVFQTSGADNCTAQNLSTTFPENWTVPAMPTANPHLEKCKTSCPEYMAMDTAAGNLTWLRDYDGAQNVRCAASNSTNQCIIDDPDCYAFFGLNRFNLTKEEEVMQFDCGCGTCPNVSKALPVRWELTAGNLRFGCQAVDTLECVKNSVACKSMAVQLQATIQQLPTARQDCENAGYPTNFGEAIPPEMSSRTTRTTPSHFWLVFGALFCAVLSFS